MLRLSFGSSFRATVAVRRVFSTGSFSAPTLRAGSPWYLGSRSSDENSFSKEFSSAAAYDEIDLPVDDETEVQSPFASHSGNKVFEVTAPYSPTGDQPEAIEQLCRQLEEGDKFSILRGITGTGKTLVMSHLIARRDLPTLVLCHNKTLAAQLARELKSFLGKNAVELFVSYYNHYVPESYVETTGKYIAKKTSINQEIDILRHRATRALLTRQDVVVVASVSCIYGLGLPEEYLDASWRVQVGELYEWNEITASLKRLLFEVAQGDDDFERGTYYIEQSHADSVLCRTLSLWPPHEKYPTEIQFFQKGSLEPDSWMISSVKVGAATGMKKEETANIFPARHHVVSDDLLKDACVAIEDELADQLEKFRSEGKYIEADRLQQRVLNDVMMLRETGFCSGGENYSRHLAGRAAGEAPKTLLDYMGLLGRREWMLMIDESHVTLPQLAAMYNGDQARKRRLVKHGYRLPSALDNRPLKQSEFWERVMQTVYVSATPSAREISESERPPVDMVIRPTFVCDPEIEVRSADKQLEDLTSELIGVAGRKERALVMTLTKRDAEDLSSYLNERGIASTFIHSGLTTNERSDALRALQMGDVDCLVGINCLREGLDLPQVSLVAILNADSEGFLRSETALLQVVGRAARNVNGKAIFYAKRVTQAMKGCIDNTTAKRAKQLAYNQEHNCQMRSTQGSSTFSIFDLLKDEIEGALETTEKNNRALSRAKDVVEVLPMRTSKGSIKVDKADIAHVPSSPGVYAWKDQEDKILYIGKAKKLRSRVRSYLSSSATHGIRIKTMLSKAAKVEIILAPTERDALILESNLIKAHQPPFNVLLKDDEHYPYIMASLSDSIPRLSIVPQCPTAAIRSKSRNRYFGPYTSFSEINAIMQAVEEKYDLRSKAFEVRHGSGDQHEYQSRFHSMLDEVFSSSRGNDSRNELNSRRCKFEEANLLFESGFNKCRDVVAMAFCEDDHTTVVVQVAQLREKIVANIFSYECQVPFGLENAEDQAAAIQSILENRHYPMGAEAPDSRFTWFPDEVLLSQDIVSENKLENVIKSARRVIEPDRRSRVRVGTASSRGEKAQVDKRAIRFVSENAHQAAYERSLTNGAVTTSVDGTAARDLAKLLSLPTPPSRIECYDISHTQGEHAVGSRVVFIDGKPARHLYRKFNIRTSKEFDSRDDYASLRQVLRRRFNRSVEGSNEWASPDLVVIDGGPGQLRAALAGIAAAKEEHRIDGLSGTDVPVCSLAKNHEEVFVVDELAPVNETPDSPALLLLRAIRDESHRFALSSHRQRRSLSKAMPNKKVKTIKQYNA